jgi:hypothetical protein
MFNTTRIAGLLVTVCLSAGAARAQPLADEPRFFVNIDGLYQAGSQDQRRTVPFTVYDEQGAFDIARRIGGGGALDISGAYRVRGSLAVGLGISRFADTATGNVAGAVPHPLFFDRHRPFALEAPDLRHRETGVHLQAIWWVPVTNEWDVAVSVGPSFFSVSQTHVADVQFVEIGAPWDAVSASIAGRADRSASGAGFNLGAESSYMLTRHLGAGVTLRFARATVDLPSGAGDASVRAGGFQVGAGLRLRY